MNNYCKHEIDMGTVSYDKTYGRTGVCKKCRKKVYATRINYNPKRERPKMSKKERIKLKKKIQEETK